MARYAVIYSETLTFTVNIVADSPEEARKIVRSGECHEGRCIDSQFEGILDIEEI